MRTLTLAFLTLTAGSVGCISAISGSGDVVEEERSVDAFREVSVAGDMNVDIVVGKRQRVLLRFDDNLLDLVKTETIDGVLHVRQNEDIAFYDTTARSVQIEVPALVAFSANGDVDAELLGIRTATFDLQVTGDSAVSANGEVTRLDVSSTGDANLHLAGLEALDVDVTATGDTDVTVYASRSIRGTLSGKSRLTVYGDPKDERVSTSGETVVEYR